MDFVFAKVFAKFAEAVFLPKNWTVSGSCSTEELDSVVFVKLFVVRWPEQRLAVQGRHQQLFASRRSVFASSPSPSARLQMLIGSPADLLRQLRQQ